MSMIQLVKVTIKYLLLSFGVIAVANGAADDSAWATLVGCLLLYAFVRWDTGSVVGKK